MRALPLFVACSLAGLAAAQSISVTAVTPITAAVQVGPASASSTHPAGALGLPIDGVGAVLPGPASSWSAGFGSWVHASQLGMEARFDLGCVLPAGVATQGSIAPCELLLSLSLPSAQLVNLQLAKSVTGPAGAAIPELKLDLNDDGVFEFTEQYPSDELELQIVIGPVPLVVRVRLAASSTTGGNLVASLSLAASPALTEAVPAFGQCTQVDFGAYGRFDGAAQIDQYLMGSGWSVVVLGLTAQPLLLGSTAAAPCLLLPSPDVLLFEPFGVSLILPIPAAARPFTFWTQAVVPLGASLGTSAAYRVNAW